MELHEARKVAEEAQRQAVELLESITTAEAAVSRETRKLKATASFVEKTLGSVLDKDEFLPFFKRPYAVIPQGKNKVLVAVPKFVKGFQVGWLWKETESFYIYQFDQYSAWLGDAPSDLLEAINFKKDLELQVAGEFISFDPAMREAVKRKLGRHLRDVGQNSARIIKGHAFDVIRETIESGCLPFKAQPVADGDRREGQSSIKLRSYQAPAVERFLETGAIGLFHPTGAGKSLVSMHLIDTLKGEKHIIVPTKTLVEQWRWYIDTYVPHAKRECSIFTYAGYRAQPTPPMLTIFDECQRLPADTFSRIAVIPTKYRIGLSASPHREDGRESYIFALTGFPVGLNWQEYMQTVGKSYHPIRVHAVQSAQGKLRKLEELLDETKRTFIFCDSIELGKEISRRFNVPFIYGES